MAHVLKFIENNQFKASLGANEWRDGYDLLVDGYVFHKFRRNLPSSSTNWRCLHKTTCTGSISVQNGNNLVTYFKPHSRTDDDAHRPLSSVELECRQFEAVVKKRCEQEDMPAGQIYTQEQSSLSQNSEASNESLASQMKSYLSMRSCLQKRKGKRRKRLPKSLKEIQLTGDQLLTLKKSKFLIQNKSQNKILVFSSPEGMKK